MCLKMRSLVLTVSSPDCLGAAQERSCLMSDPVAEPVWFIMDGWVEFNVNISRWQSRSGMIRFVISAMYTTTVDRHPL